MVTWHDFDIKLALTGREAGPEPELRECEWIEVLLACAVQRHARLPEMINAVRSRYLSIELARRMVKQ